MSVFSRILIVTGVILIIFGLALPYIEKVPGLGKLPGDILVKRGDFTFYFPITTCVIISLVLSVVFFLWQQK